MTAKLHLICQSQKGFSHQGDNIHLSEMWELNDNEVQQIKGGVVHFHETKAQPSYFGGEVLDVYPAPDEVQDDGRVRYIIKLKATLEAKNQKWPENGHRHAMAVSSGIV